MPNSAIVGILRALLVADTAQFDTALNRSKDKAKVWAKEIKEVGAEATKVGSALSIGITAPLLALGAAASKLAIDFESSFAGVRKTVDASEGEFQAMAAAFRGLAKEIPVNVNELNKLGEAAGALGIPKGEIVDFARVMAQLGVTTNLTSDQAANAIARIQNIFGAAGKDTERLASTLVALGNAGASTESEIVQMGQRIAGAGHSIGLTQAQVLGFASAMASVGISAEEGGSAISRVFIKMNDAVKAGGAGLDAFAKVAGGTLATGTAFKKAFETDAAGAVQAFVEGLGRMQAEGKNLNPILEGLIGKNIVLKDVLTRLAGAGGLLGEQLKIGADAWERNTALTDEARKRFETTESKLKLLGNRLVDVGITIGNALLPAIKTLIGFVDSLLPAIEGLAKWFAELPGPIQAVAIAMGVLAAGIGPVLFLFGQLLTATATVTAAFAKGGLASTALGRTFVSLATGEVGLIILALTGLAAIIYKVATYESALEKDVRTNTATFHAHRIELNNALDTYDGLARKAGLTADETKRLDAATQLLAKASGLSADEFRKQTNKSNELTLALREQARAQADIEEAEKKRLERTAAAAKAAADRAEAQLNRIKQGVVEVDKLAGANIPGGEADLRPMDAGEKTAAIKEQEAKVKDLKDEYAAAKAAVEAFTGAQNAGTAAARSAVDTLADLRKAVLALEPAQRKAIDAGIALHWTTAQIATDTGVAATTIDAYRQGLGGLRDAEDVAAEGAGGAVAALAALRKEVADLTPAEKAEIEALDEMGRSHEKIAKAIDKTVEVVDLYFKGQKSAATETRKTAKEVEEATQAYREATLTINDLTADQVIWIEDMLKAGVAAGVIGKSLGVTQAQIRAVDTVMKENTKTVKELDKAWEKFNEDQKKQADQSATAQSRTILETLKLEREAAFERSLLGKTELDAEIARIRERAQEQKDAYTGMAEWAQKYYDAVDAMADNAEQRAIERDAERRRRDREDDEERKKKKLIEDQQRAYENLIGTLLRVGDAGDKAFNQLAGAIGGALADMKALEQSGATVSGGLGQFMAGDKMGGAMNMVAGGIGAAQDIMDFQKVAGASTDRRKNALSGAMQGAKIGSQIMPGWGTAIGAGIGAIAGAMMDGHKAVRKQLGEFADTYGGFDKLHEKMAKDLGSRSDALWIKLTQAKDPKQNLAALEEIKKAFEEVAKAEAEAAARHEKMGEALGVLGGQLEVFGGTAPAALRPAIQSMMEMAGIPDDIKTGLAGMLEDPSWQTMQTTAENLGISLEALGPKFSQARIGDTALGYVRDLKMFEDAGADMQGVIVGMSDEISGMYQEAEKSGAALPDTLKPYMQTLVDQGLLLDANGEKVKDLSKVAFKEIDDKALKDVQKTLGEIHELLDQGLPAAAKKAASDIAAAFAAHPIVVPYTFEQTGPGPGAPPQIGLSGGTHGEYVDWGSGTPVVLHGREAVVPEGEGLGGGAVNITVVSALDGREIARNQVRYIPDALRRAGI